MTRLPSLLAAALAVGLGLWAWSARTGAAGGSDSACYALMARVFAEGARQPMSVLAEEAPWPDATRVAAPAGFLPSVTRRGAAVPVCAPGYSLLLAPLVFALGVDAVHLAPAVAAGLVVWLAFVLGRNLGSPIAGVAAAALVATTPIVLFQAVQPMNDITTGALWMGVAVAMARARPALTGLLVGVAVLVRPNLVLGGAAAIAGAAWLWTTQIESGRTGRFVRALVTGGLCAVPGVAIAMALNWALYGSPLQSGYGDLGVLFAAGHVPVNIARYGRTWIATGSPLVLLAPLAWWAVPASRRASVLAVMLLAAALAVVYLAYRPFDEWWFLRFLVPSVALVAVLAACSLSAAAAWLWPRGAAILVTGVVAGVASYALRTSATAEATRLQALEARFPDTAHVIADRFDSGAVPITIWHSGGLRYWPGRDVVVWDALDAGWLDPAIEWLQTHGRAPVIVVERWEEAGFRARFAGQAFGGLDWPPRFDVDRRVRLFVPEDRERYLRGEAVATEYVFGPRRAR
jgi:hypothetical protein